MSQVSVLLKIYGSHRNANGLFAVKIAENKHWYLLVSMRVRAEKKEELLLNIYV